MAWACFTVVIFTAVKGIRTFRPPEVLSLKILNVLILRSRRSTFLKRIKFLYKAITTKKPRWLARRRILSFLCLIIFLLIMRIGVNAIVPWDLEPWNQLWWIFFSVFFRLTPSKICQIYTKHVTDKMLKSQGSHCLEQIVLLLSATSSIHANATCSCNCSWVSKAEYVNAQVKRWLRTADWV